MSTLQKEFDRICSESNLIGATSIVVKENKNIEELVYGFQSREKKTKTTLDTVYRIASVSKIEVAVCAMKYVEKGLLDLDTDISKYLGFTLRNPIYPDDIITMRFLMTHTSSISDGFDTELGAPIDTGYLHVICIDDEPDLEELIVPGGKYYVPETFNGSKPGTKFEYSNFNTGILACIIERVTGKYFVDVFQEVIAKPLGIKASFMASDMKDYPIADTYYNDLSLARTAESFVSKSIHKRKLGNNFVGPAGGLFISIKDLATLMIQYMNDGGKILGKETMDKMLEMNFYGDTTDDYTAKGLQIQILDAFDNKRLYGHFGTAYGVKSFLFFNPSQKLGFVFISNGGGYKMLPSCISDVQTKLINLYLDKYWDNSKESTLVFSPSDNYAYLDNRKISIKYKAPTRRVLSRKPFLDEMTMMDLFNISTLNKRSDIEKDMYGKHVFEYLAYLNNEYEYDCSTKEEFLNNDFDRKNAKYTFTFKYKRKENASNPHLDENYHTHCNYCDHAVGGVMDYMDFAYNAGYKTIGMSDHGPLPLSFIGVTDTHKIENNDGYVNGQMSYDVFLYHYLKDIEEAQKKYQGKMNILKSIEIEYISGHDEYYKELLTHLDYLLMGEHFVMTNGKFLDAYFDINSTNVIDYAKEVVKGINTKMFKIIAHPDLYMYYYISENNKLREFDTNAGIAARMIIEACANTGTMIELNVGGLGKGTNDNYGKLEYSYPRSEFWKIAKEYKDKLKVVIGCDAHDPKALDCNNLYKLIRLAKEWGFSPINLRK